MKQRFFSLVRHGLERAGLRVDRDRAVRDPQKLMVKKARELGVNTMLDIGANLGQYGREMRRLGYRGALVSFEPLGAAHAALSRVAAHDRAWHVAERMALGDENTTTEINVSHNLASSSLLQVNQRSIDAAPVSDFSGRETIQLRRLDDVIDAAWRAPFAMKIDTQGFELHMLRGAPKTLENTQLIMIEMSLVPLYEGGASFVNVYEVMEQAGFRCITLTHGFCDYEHDELLQVDGVFARYDK